MPVVKGSADFYEAFVPDSVRLQRQFPQVCDTQKELIYEAGCLKSVAFLLEAFLTDVPYTLQGLQTGEVALADVAASKALSNFISED